MSAPAPGTTVIVSAAAPSGASTETTGQFFALGLTQRGPVGVPIFLTSLNDFETFCGARESYSPLYDCADVCFQSGVTSMIVSRVVGPAATTAFVELLDQGGTPQDTIKVSAIGPGADGNNLTVQTVAGPVAGTYQLKVFYAGALVETSPALATPADAANWGTLNPAQITSNASKWVAITNLGSTSTNTQPALLTNPVALTGGADDNADAGDTQYEAALNAFGPDLGPGQIAACGRTSSATLVAIAQHGLANNRFPLFDTVAGTSAATMASLAQTVQTAIINAGADPSYGAFFTAVTWQGVPTGTPVPAWPRTIPGSAAAAALCALNDASNDCNVAAAGPNGVLAGALGVVQQFSTADRATLNSAGVNPFILKNNTVELYGWQSLASDPNWQDLSSVRFRMQLTNDAKNVGDNYDFAQVDGQGQVISAYVGDLTAMLAGYYTKGSLYGATAADAYSVDGGPTVNTPATIAARQLNAVMDVVMSPSAETVSIQIIKYLVGASF